MTTATEVVKCESCAHSRSVFCLSNTKNFPNCIIYFFKMNPPPSNTVPYPIGNPIRSSFLADQLNKSNTFDKFAVGQVIRIESNVYAFKCSQCDLEFRDGGQFSLHSELHFKSKNDANEKVDLGYDYDNNNQQKEQRNSAEIEDELLIESKSSPVKSKSLITCLFCSKFFKIGTMLRHHQNKAHAEDFSEIKKNLKEKRRMFKCLICNRNFMKKNYNQYSVEKHIKKHMDEEEQENIK